MQQCIIRITLSFLNHVKGSFEVDIIKALFYVELEDVFELC